MTSQSPRLRRTHCPRLRSRTPDPEGWRDKKKHLFANFFRHILTPQKIEMWYTIISTGLFFLQNSIVLVVAIHHLSTFILEAINGFLLEGSIRWAFRDCKRLTICTTHYQPMLCGLVGKSSYVRGTPHVQTHPYHIVGYLLFCRHHPPSYYFVFFTGFSRGCFHQL